MEKIKEKIQDLKPLVTLKALALQNLRNRFPSIPERAIPKPKYSDKTANGLSKCITGYINLIGGMAERRSNTGRQLKGKSYTNIFGKEVQLSKGKWIPGTGRNGTADISGIYKGTPLAVEVKISNDKLSIDQKRYAEDFAQAGGVFIVARSFAEFYNEFNERLQI